MKLWRRAGLSLLVVTVILVSGFWHKLLPFPLFVMAGVWMLFFYAIHWKRIRYRWIPFVIAMVALPMGGFVYMSHNSLRFWGTDALAILGAGAVSLLAFRFEETPNRHENSFSSLSR